MGKASRKKQLQRQTKHFDGVKLSQALLDLSEPFNPDKDLGINEFEKLIALAASAWNIANSPKEKQFEELMSIIDKVIPKETIPIKKELNAHLANIVGTDYQDEPFSDAETMGKMLVTMIRIKEALYLDDKRTIVDFSVADTPRGHRVTVSSMMPDSHLDQHSVNLF
jgi:hypothetical protein